MLDESDDPLDIAESIQKSKKKTFGNRLNKVPFSDLWLWPMVEVIFIALFSLSPIVFSALYTVLRSRERSANLYDTVLSTIHAGNLIYYALGFIATAAWIVWADIDRSRIARVFLGGIIVLVVMSVSTTVGLDAKTSTVNVGVLRSTSYYIFVLSLAAYFFALVLKAWQPMMSVEDSNRAGERSLLEKSTGGTTR